MVVHIVVLAGDAVPIDGAVGVDMLGDDLVLGVHEALEAEGVGAVATGQHIVHGRERGGLVRKDLRRAVLRRHHFAGIRTAQQDVVAAAAVHTIGAEAADQKIVAVATGQRVVARAAPDLVIAVAAVEHVVARHAGDRVVGATGKQHVAAVGPVQMIVA